MSIYTQKSVEIEVVEGGWVLTWNDDTKRVKNQFVSTMGGIEAPTRGREIITSQKKLIERVKALT